MFYTWMARRGALVVSTAQRSVTYLFTREAITIAALKKTQDITRIMLIKVNLKLKVFWKYFS